VTALVPPTWAWFLLAVVLIVLGLVVVGGVAGTIVLACGFVALFGAGIRVISRNDSRPRGERRLPAGHSGA
jgi:hypothetical protein